MTNQYDDETNKLRDVNFPCGCIIRYVGTDEYYRKHNCSLHKNMSNEAHWNFLIAPTLGIMK